MSPDRKTIYVDVPTEVLRRIEDICAEANITVSQFMIEAALVKIIQLQDDELDWHRRKLAETKMKLRNLQESLDDYPEDDMVVSDGEDKEPPTLER